MESGKSTMSIASPMDFLCLEMDCDVDPDSESCDNDDQNDKDYVCTKKDSGNAKEQNLWALGLFEAWAENRPMLETERYRKLDKPLHKMDDDELNFWLSRFISEVRDRNGDHYNARTLKNMSKALQTLLNLHGKNVRLLTDVKYAAIRVSLDAEIRRIKDMTVWNQGITAKGEKLPWRSEEPYLVTPQLASQATVSDKGIQTCTQNGSAQNTSASTSNTAVTARAPGSPTDYYKSQRRGKPLKGEQKQTILNVYCKLRQKHPNMFIEDVVAKTAELTGVNARTIFKMKKEFKTSGGNLQTPGKTRPRRVGKNIRLEKYDDLTLSAIRKKIYGFLRKGGIPTARKVCSVINADPELPDFTERTMHRVIVDLGFLYKTRGRNSLLIEREDLVLWRRRYLRQIREHVKRYDSVYYLDEMRVDASVGLQDTAAKCKKDASSNGPPTAKDGRLIFLHVGNENGFVKGADLIFRAEKGSGDSHEELDGPRFEKWFTEQVLPSIRPNSMIVIDNKPYNSVKVEGIPADGTRKAEIQAWLTSKSVAWDPSMILKELLVLVNQVKHLYDHYRIDVTARLHGHTVLRLPPYHCELNPIELIWSQVKGFVTQQNHSYTTVEVERLAYEAIAGITPEIWAGCVSHVRTEEENMWEMDALTDAAVEKMTFQNGGSSSDDDDDDDSLSGSQELE